MPQHYVGGLAPGCSGEHAVGNNVLGTIFFATFDHHLPPGALRVTAWACLVPLAAAFALVFRLPMHPRAEEVP